MLSLANRLKQLLNQDQELETVNSANTGDDATNLVDGGGEALTSVMKSEEGSKEDENEETVSEQSKNGSCEKTTISSDGEDSEKGDKASKASVPNTVPKLTKAEREEMKTRSVYAEVFPEDAGYDDLVAFFETYGPVEKLVLRNDPLEKVFKGYVFVIFSTRCAAEKFMAEDGTKYGDVELSRKEFKDDYYKELRARAKGKKKKKKTGPKVSKSAKKSANLPVDEAAQKLYEERARNEMTKNSVVHVGGLASGTDRRDIKKVFSDYVKVCHVEFEEGTEGYVRLKEADSAGPTIEKMMEANNGKIIINEAEVELRVVQGDEEVVYWTRLFKNVTEKQAVREERREKKLKKKIQHERNPHPKYSFVPSLMDLPPWHQEVRPQSQQYRSWYDTLPEQNGPYAITMSSQSYYEDQCALHEPHQSMRWNGWSKAGGMHPQGASQWRNGAQQQGRGRGRQQNKGRQVVGNY